MDGYSISQVAERTGFAPSALRFYEQTGLVQPGRTAAGYRSYDDADLRRLGFVARAKGFGLSLDEITEVLALLDGERCEPVQERLRALVAAKVADAQVRTAELVAFTAELQRVAAQLEHHTPDGPCDDSCGCTTAVAGAVVTATTGGAPPSVPLAMGRRPMTAEPIACTLGAAEVDARLQAWRQALDGATGREPVPGGIRVRFPVEVDVGALASLAAAEQDCCRFFTFVLTIDADGVALDITGEPEAQPVIVALVGAP